MTSSASVAGRIDAVAWKSLRFSSPLFTCQYSGSLQLHKVVSTVGRTYIGEEPRSLAATDKMKKSFRPHLSSQRIAFSSNETLRFAHRAYNEAYMVDLLCSYLTILCSIFDVSAELWLKFYVMEIQLSFALSWKKYYNYRTTLPGAKF